MAPGRSCFACRSLQVPPRGLSSRRPRPGSGKPTREHGDSPSLRACVRGDAGRWGGPLPLDRLPRTSGDLCKGISSPRSSRSSSPSLSLRTKPPLSSPSKDLQPHTENCRSSRHTSAFSLNSSKLKQKKTPKLKKQSPWQHNRNMCKQIVPAEAGTAPPPVAHPPSAGWARGFL